MAFTIPKSQFNMPEFLRSEKARKVLMSIYKGKHAPICFSYSGFLNKKLTQ